MQLLPLQCQFAMQIDRRVKDAAPYGVNDKHQFIFLPVLWRP